MDNSTRRRMRIDQIFKQIVEAGAVDKEEMISFCSVNYGLSRRTTREYLNDLTILKYIKEEEGDIIPLKKMPKKTREKEFDKMVNSL